MTKIYLSLVFHNHQPVGNFHSVFAEAFEKAYHPLTNCLDRHPNIKVTMQFTGPLIDWLKEHQPAYLDQVAGQVARGQLEILSGGYYEPILSMLQDADKLGQIRKMNETVEEIFGTKPRGMWLAERIWEPHFAKPIREAGIDYTIIDDAHFKAAGFTPEQLFGYFVTEEQGYPLKLLPTQTKLRYLIPWRSVGEVIGWLREQADERHIDGKSPVWAIMGDDGEKFGLWPQTYQSIWGEKWMDQFFDALESNSHWIETIQPQSYLEQFPAWGRAYIPTASYMEMGEWALPSPQSYYLRDLREQYQQQLEYIPQWDDLKRQEYENILQFLRGSFWRNFLVKYPEINQMHKRGLALSKRLHALPDTPEKQAALEALWASQCNCAYWHGVFGGVYLFHIRSANYSNIIGAEVIADELEGRTGLWYEKTDFNADSYNEILASNGQLAIVVEPAQGGMITELDYRPLFYNLLNIMSRHPEGYHIQIREAAETNMLMTPEDDRSQFEGEPVRAKEKGLEEHIHTDWHRHGMFLDHFFGEGAHLHNFVQAQYPEEGDFTNQWYKVQEEQTAEQISIILTREGGVWANGVHQPVLVRKTIVLEKNASHLIANYEVINKGDAPLQTRFGIETAMGFDGGDNRDYHYLRHGDDWHGLGDAAEFDDVTNYEVMSERHGFAVHLELSRAAHVWHYPLAPITLSEGGFERVHQGIVLLQWWHLNLGKNETWQTSVKVAIVPRPVKDE